MAAMTKTPGRATRKTTASGQAIIASLREIRAWQRGEVALDVTEIPDPMPPARVKTIRRKVAR
jgi:hypothetical protein